MSKLPPIETDEDGRRLYTPAHIRKFRSACKELLELHELGAVILTNGEGDFFLLELTDEERLSNPNLESKKLGSGYSTSQGGTYFYQEDITDSQFAGVFYSNTIE